MRAKPLDSVQPPCISLSCSLSVYLSVSLSVSLCLCLSLSLCLCVSLSPSLFLSLCLSSLSLLPCSCLLLRPIGGHLSLSKKETEETEAAKKPKGLMAAKKRQQQQSCSKNPCLAVSSIGDSKTRHNNRGRRTLTLGPDRASLWARLSLATSGVSSPTLSNLQRQQQQLLLPLQHEAVGRAISCDSHRGHGAAAELRDSRGPL